MGASQSTNVSAADGAARTIFIDENDIPEAYRRVGVSDEVVEAVARASRVPGKIVFDGDPSPSKISNDLLKERQENQRLREELQRLTTLKHRLVPPQPPPSSPPVQQRPQTTQISREEVDEKKRTFEDTVDRVKKQFFGYQRENVCTDVEKKLMSCLANNKSTVLNCQPLQYDYDLCIANFRAQVLKEQHVTPKAQVNEQN